MVPPLPGRLAPQGQRTRGWSTCDLRWDLRPIDEIVVLMRRNVNGHRSQNQSDTRSRRALRRNLKMTGAVARNALDEIDFPTQIFTHRAARVAAALIRLEPHVDRIIRHVQLLRQRLPG